MQIQHLIVPDYLKGSIEKGICTACFFHKSILYDTTSEDSEITLITEQGDQCTPPKDESYTDENGRLHIYDVRSVTVIKVMNQQQLPARRIFLWHDNPNNPPTREYIAINPRHPSTLDYVIHEMTDMDAEQLERWLGKIQFEKREQESEFVLISWKAPRG